MAATINQARMIIAPLLSKSAMITATIAHRSLSTSTPEMLRASWRGNAALASRIATTSCAVGGSASCYDVPTSQQRCASSLAPPRYYSTTTTTQPKRQHHCKNLSNTTTNNYSQQQRNFARGTHRSTNHQQQRGNRNDRFDTYSYDGNVIQKDTKNILIIGSSGILGKTLVSQFGNEKDWNVLGADVAVPALDDIDPTSEEGGEELELNDYISLSKSGSLADLTGELYRGVSSNLQGDDDASKNSSKHNKLDAIICASGGWAGDVDIANVMEHHLADKANSGGLEDVDIEEEYARESAEVCERMMRMNYFPIVAGGQVGRRFMKRGGLFVIIGASAALSPTPGMLGYGSAKSATHHYLQSMGPASHQENDTTSVGILPLMIDTPTNRSMVDDSGDKGSDTDERYNKMVKPIHIANEIGEWIKQPHLRPHSGSLVKVIAKSRRDGSGGAAFHLVR